MEPAHIDQHTREIVITHGPAVLTVTAEGDAYAVRIAWKAHDGPGTDATMRLTAKEGGALGLLLSNPAWQSQILAVETWAARDDAEADQEAPSERILNPYCHHLFAPLTADGQQTCMRCGGVASREWVRDWMMRGAPVRSWGGDGAE